MARTRLRRMLEQDPDVEIVAECADGLAAVAAVQEESPDLLLLDIQMPGMDGFETIRAIRGSAGAVAGIPVVAMTANAMAGDRDDCLAAGMDDYVSKPLNRRSLGALLEKWIDRIDAPLAAPPRRP